MSRRNKIKTIIHDPSRQKEYWNANKDNILKDVLVYKHGNNDNIYTNYRCRQGYIPSKDIYRIK